MDFAARVEAAAECAPFVWDACRRGVVDAVGRALTLQGGPGHNYVMSGPPGVGKSVLLRALAGAAAGLDPGEGRAPVVALYVDLCRVAASDGKHPCWHSWLVGQLRCQGMPQDLAVPAHASGAESFAAVDAWLRATRGTLFLAVDGVDEVFCDGGDGADVDARWQAMYFLVAANQCTDMVRQRVRFIAGGTDAATVDLCHGTLHGGAAAWRAKFPGVDRFSRWSSYKCPALALQPPGTWHDWAVSVGPVCDGGLSPSVEGFRATGGCIGPTVAAVAANAWPPAPHELPAYVRLVATQCAGAMKHAAATSVWTLAKALGTSPFTADFQAQVFMLCCHGVLACPRGTADLCDDAVRRGPRWQE
jgi:hypothetical protein